MKLTFLLLLTFFHTLAQQPELPYREIPDYPTSYTAATVSARMVDGLGFRYYWATEGLRPEDLSYSLNDDARTTNETLIHIYELSRNLFNSVNQVPNTTEKTPSMSFAELRQKTLEKS